MSKRTLALLALVIGAIASGSALAHHGHARVTLGFHFGVPLYSWYYPPPYYYYPPPVYYYPYAVAPASPPAYVERADPVPEQRSQGWWYYCEQTRGYYPYVKDCPGGWQRVPPAPPPAN